LRTRENRTRRSGLDDNLKRKSRAAHRAIRHRPQEQRRRALAGDPRRSRLYDVAVLPGVRRPMAVGFKTDEIRRVLTVERGSPG
jgi:hypothetical protein